MTTLDVPVPPQLEEAVGYRGGARFFALSWEPCGDESMYDDGRSSGTGNWSGYLTWVRHPTVAPATLRFDLGASDSEATHWLVIDRRERKVSVAPVREAARFLHEQWLESPAGPVVLSQEELAELKARLVAELRAMPMLTCEQVKAALEQQRRVEAEMVTWLDEHQKK